MDTKQVAELLKVDEQTIRRWIAARRLEAYDIGKEYRVSQEALQRFLETIKVQAGEGK